LAVIDQGGSYSNERSFWHRPFIALVDRNGKHRGRAGFPFQHRFWDGRQQ
jgi:hypothetical protein